MNTSGVIFIICVFFLHHYSARLSLFTLHGCHFDFYHRHQSHITEVSLRVLGCFWA